MTSPLTGQRSRSELIAELFERHAAGLFAYCHDQLGETASAADAVVAVFTTTPATPEPPSRAVLYALARREIYRRDVSYALPAVDSVADPATALIERVFRDIRPHQREVLLLSEVCGLTPPELSLVLDVAGDTAEELAAGARRRFTQTLATAVAAARSAPFVPPPVAEVYDAIGVAPIADVLARLPWRHPSASVRNRVLAALPYEEPGDSSEAGPEQAAEQSGARSGGLVTKRLWPTTPTWPLPLSDPDQVTNTCVVNTEAITPQESRRKAKHEATTEPMPRLRGALLNSLTEGRLRRKRATRPEPRSQETREQETPAETRAQESPAQESLAAPVEPLASPQFPSQALPEAVSQALSQPPSQDLSQPSGFGVPESAGSVGHAGHATAVGAEGLAADRSNVDWFSSEGFDAERSDAEPFEAFRPAEPADPFDAFAPATPPGVARPADPPPGESPSAESPSADPLPGHAVFADDPQRQAPGQVPGERRGFDAFTPAGPLPPGESFDAFTPVSPLPTGESFDAFTPADPATASRPGEPFDAAHTLLFETLRSAEPFDAFAAPGEAPPKPADESAPQPTAGAAEPDPRPATEAASPPEASGPSGQFWQSEHPEPSTPSDAFPPAESAAIPQVVFPEAEFPQAEFPATGFPQVEFPQVEERVEDPAGGYPAVFREDVPPAVSASTSHDASQDTALTGGYPAAFREDVSPAVSASASRDVSQDTALTGEYPAAFREGGAPEAPQAEAEALDPTPAPDTASATTSTSATAPAAAAASPAAVPAAVPASSPVAPGRKDGKRTAKKHTNTGGAKKAGSAKEKAGSTGNAGEAGARAAGKGSRKKSDRHYDWLWEAVGFLICLIIALVVFFTVPTIVTH
ncbi:hypothetical protein [Microbispora amethystogenes]|uniref:RNA polymerase sigma factor 70 region 4 type 2 domain-containing protein n=1 Tax=Microbispora amethystogenes TaxID=1427754 RepID=A0ABQ4FGN3_9ACTN|nr:hypothetical protein [Microbispora amethystogenes]GIH33960.1 hypothetical protein Mam01_41240 [Microbispora amethystogenes]